MDSTPVMTYSSNSLTSTSPTSSSLCLLCGLSYHALLGFPVLSSSLHPLCLRFLRPVSGQSVYRRRMPDMNVVKHALSRAPTVLCVFCLKPGAAAGCHSKICDVVFHLPCSLGRDVVNRQDNFLSYCRLHRRPQDRTFGSTECGVCGWTVSLCDQITAPCCNTGHHHSCLQILASHGVSVCPSCHSSDTFLSQMVYSGIWFPEPVKELAWIAALEKNWAGDAE